MLTTKLARSLQTRTANTSWLRYLNSSCSNGSAQNGSSIARHFSSKPWIPGVSMDTDMVHGGVDPDEKTGAILTPVYLSTTFVQ
ncbi:hypothetical protein THAOC_22029, partial [Thalassiosira oceanica]